MIARNNRKRNDAPSAAMLAGNLDGSSDGLHENTGAAHALNPDGADFVDDVKQAVPVFKLGRLFNEENGFKIVERQHPAPFPTQTFERPAFIPRGLNSGLMQIKLAPRLPAGAGRSNAPCMLRPLFSDTA